MIDTIQKPIYSQALTWVLILPLLFFVVRGTFSLDRPQSGNFTQSEEDALSTTGAGSAYYQAQQAFMYLVVVAAIFPSIFALKGVIQDNLVVFSLPIWAVLSILWSQERLKTVPFAVFIVLLTTFGAYISYRYSPERQLKLFLFVGWFTILLSIGAALLYPAAGLQLSYGITAWRGIWVQKNNCAEVTTLLIFAAFFIKPKSTLQKAGLILYVLLGTGLVIMSQSRTGWLLLAISFSMIAFLKIFQRIKGSDRLFLVAVVVSFLLIVVTIAALYGTQILIAMGKDPTLTGRTEIWRLLEPELWKRPFTGWGYRAFWLGLKGESANFAYVFGGTGLQNAENSVMEIWLDLGLIGVFLALFTLYHATRNAITCLNQDAPQYVYWFIMIVFDNLLSLVDGDKIMFPHTMEWLLLVVAYIGLSKEAHRIRTLGPA